jgi:hypothetical protein
MCSHSSTSQHFNPKCYYLIHKSSPLGWLDSVGRHRDRLAAHKELQRFLSPREYLVGTAVRGLRSPACCILTEKDMCSCGGPCTRMWLVRCGTLPELVWGGPCAATAVWWGALVPLGLLQGSVARQGFSGARRTWAQLLTLAGLL